MDFTSAYSNLSNEDGRDKTEFSPTVLTFAGVITFIIMIIGIFGNFLTVAALYKCPKVRNVAAAFIISLCMADLLFCAIVLPFSALRFLKGTWTHGKFLCKLIPFIQYGNIGVSLLCIAMITINRYVMIAHHASYAKIYRKHWIAVMIIFCWAFSYGMQLPTLLGVWGTFDYDEKLETCSIMNDQHGRSSKTTLFITAFIIPALVIIACYTKIFWVVRQSELRLKTHANQQNSILNNLRPVQTPTGTVMESEQNRVSSNLASDSSFSTDVKQDAIQKPSRIKDQREMRAKRNEWRITKMVLAIFLSFVICYLPITIAKVADKDVEYPNFHIFSYIMLYLSACINPIIYVIMNKQYRKAYKTVIMCEPSKLLPFRKSTAAGSSAAEKWKDTALSNNHSRTMVSQMSVEEQQNCNSDHVLQPQQYSSMELTNKVYTQSALENTVEESIATQKKQTILPGPLHMPQASPLVNHSSLFTQRVPNKDLHRIVMVGDDIILEEEEEVATPSQPASSIHPEVKTMSTMSKDGVLKKVPYYGQNINITPDNDVKLIAKPKIIKTT
nr:G-protein coupled receptor moody isoform X1 [Bactrocera oleae]XP_036218304.1 G-protein coupled receptor moody isoform X1 [Bactrocera oleae]XP_036218305.1 G-protein coupled receptor moody isoform X1 [Bactrocera oleae]XP_036218306.1 G-protein coupled receptor moody isoform X1 [Bactrocera oleae]